MRNKVSVLYYPDQTADQTTLKKAILSFDEIHFMDRPSFMFGGGIGTIGMASQLRAFEQRFRDDGIPLFVHTVPSGPVHGTFLEEISADVNDPAYLLRFQEGMRRSETFRDLNLGHGNYGDSLTHIDVAKKLDAIDLSKALVSNESAMALLTDQKIRPYNFSDPESTTKTLIFLAAICSAKMNFSLNLGSRNGFVPLADAAPYGDLLGAKYARAMRSLDQATDRLLITDLSFAIFDELVPTAQLEQMSIPDVIRYRHASDKPREEFLEYLGALQQKQANIGRDGDYARAVRSIIETEVMPAARTFKNKMQTTGEAFWGSLAKGVLGSAGGYIGGVQLFGDLSWEKLLAISGMAAVYVGQAAVDGLAAERATRRECSLSYILSLDK